MDENTEVVTDTEIEQESAEVKDEPAAVEAEPSGHEEVDKEVEYKAKTKQRIQGLLTQRDYWRQKALAAEQSMQGERKPTMEEVDHDIEKYQDAAMEYRIRQIESETVGRQAKSVENEVFSQVQQTWAEIQGAAVKAYPDFTKVFTTDLPVTPAMGETIISCDKPAEVAYYLGKNREEATRIARLPAHLQGMEIAKIDGKMLASTKPSTAPEPLSSRSRGVGGRGSKSYDEMTDDEFAAARAKERAAWRERNL